MTSTKFQNLASSENCYQNPYRMKHKKPLSLNLRLIARAQRYKGYVLLSCRQRPNVTCKWSNTVQEKGEEFSLEFPSI